MKMRVERFKAWLVEQLEASGHPGIESIGSYEVPSVTNPTIHCADGREIRLFIVGTAPPKGDDHSKDEQIVHRDPSTPIQVIQRGKD